MSTNAALALGPLYCPPDHAPRLSARPSGAPLGEPGGGVQRQVVGVGKRLQEAGGARDHRRVVGAELPGAGMWTSTPP